MYVNHWNGFRGQGQVWGNLGGKNWSGGANVPNGYRTRLVHACN